MSLIRVNRVKVLLDVTTLSGLYRDLEQIRKETWKTPEKLVLLRDKVLTAEGELRKWVIKYPSLGRLFIELGCFYLCFEVVSKSSRYLQVHFEEADKHTDQIFKEDCITYFGICNDIDLTNTLKDVNI